MRTTLAFLMLGVLVAPLASAGPFDSVAFAAPLPRVGDLVHHVMMPDAADRPAAEIVLHVEGAARTFDKHGREREAIAIRVDAYDNGAFERAERCHLHKDGGEVVRTVLIAGDGYGAGSVEGSGGDVLSGQFAFEENSTVIVRFDGGVSCYHAASIYGKPRTHREGESVRLDELLADAAGAADVTSAPAKETRFHGRRALVYSFDVSGRNPEIPGDVRLDLTVAEGIPGIASASVETAEGGRLFQEVRGFTPGKGETVSLSGDARLDGELPPSMFTTYDPLTLDDNGLSVPFPYREAFSALVDDPGSGARAWLDAHPDAALVYALAEPMPGADTASPVGASGSWWLMFRSNSTVATWLVERGDRIDSPLGGTTLPLPTYRVYSQGTAEYPIPMPDRPTRVLTGRAMAALAQQAGLDRLAPRLEFRFVEGGDGWADMLVAVTDVARGAEDADGHGVQIDAAGGELASITATRYRAEVSNGLLPDVEPVAANPVAAHAADLLVRPTPLAIGATSAALALLLVALRFLVPLYTRLRRDRLLEHPVRARLYARIRAEPGIHLAALDALDGVGKGGTKHHLDQLVRHKLVFVVAEPHFIRHYAAGSIPPSAARHMSILRAGSHARVYELFADKPTLSLREAARELGMSAPSVHRAKKRLVKEGLLPAAPAADVLPAAPR